MSRSLKIDSSEDQIRAIQTLEMAGVEIRAIQIRAEIISKLKNKRIIVVAFKIVRCSKTL
jgi:hypothetical protein